MELDQEDHCSDCTSIDAWQMETGLCLVDPVYTFD